MVLIKIDVLSVIVLALQMPIIVRNVFNKKKIGMDVPRLLIWDRLGLISFIKRKNMDLLKRLDLLQIAINI